MNRYPHFYFKKFMNLRTERQNNKPQGRCNDSISKIVYVSCDCFVLWIISFFFAIQDWNVYNHHLPNRNKIFILKEAHLNKIK